MNTKTDTTETAANPWMEGVRFINPQLVDRQNPSKIGRVLIVLFSVIGTCLKLVFLAVIGLLSIAGALSSTKSEWDEDPVDDPDDPYTNCPHPLYSQARRFWHNNNQL